MCMTCRTHIPWVPWDCFSPPNCSESSQLEVAVGVFMDPNGVLMNYGVPKRQLLHYIINYNLFAKIFGDFPGFSSF